MKKYLIAVILLVISFLFFYHFKVCNLKRFTNSSINFGFIYSLKHCNNDLKILIKHNVKKAIVSTPFEIYFRRISDSGSYQVINKNNLKNINEQNLKKNDLNALRPEGQVGLIKNLEENLYSVPDNSEFSTWERSHGGDKNLKFSNTNIINSNNIENIKLKWKFETNQIGKFSSIQANPVFTQNRIFFTSSNGKIISLNASTGKKIWELQTIKNIRARGLLLDVNKNNINTFLFVPIDKKMFKINISNGKIVKEFGKNGYINIKTLAAPIIYKNNICAARVYPATIECFNKINGESKFKINIHDNKNFKSGGTVWGGIALDKKNGLVYVVTGNPRPALIGIDRPGDNKHTNSIVAISLEKQRIVWSVQDVIHDLWDYDISAPPIITDIKFEDNSYFKALLVISKIGNFYILDRENGKNLFDLDYKKVNYSKIIGELNSRYQVDLKVPKTLIDLNISKNDFTQKTKVDFSNKIKHNYFSLGEFSPPKLGGSVIAYGIHGGVTWPGFSVNPKKNIAFIPVNNLPYEMKLELKTYSTIKSQKKGYSIYKTKCASCHGNHRNGDFEYKFSHYNRFGKGMDLAKKYTPSLVGHSLFNTQYNKFLNKEYINDLHGNELINKNEEILLKKLFKDWDNEILDKSEMYYKYDWQTFVNSDGVPATKPPWGKIMAINLKNGQKLWETPIGKINNQIIGTPIYGGVATNSGDILVATGTSDNLIYFIDQKNGKILKTFEMKSGGTAPPMIYKNQGSEQITVISGGMGYTDFNQRMGTSIYTFSLD